jgi:hypothetical protein
MQANSTTNGPTKATKRTKGRRGTREDLDGSIAEVKAKVAAVMGELAMRAVSLRDGGDIGPQELDELRDTLAGALHSVHGLELLARQVSR